jgi:transcriptional regulator with XRE-family HTH domain
MQTERKYQSDIAYRNRSRWIEPVNTPNPRSNMNRKSKICAVDSASAHATLGSRIRRRRLALRATLVEIAERADIDPGNLSRIERDLQSPSANALYRIAEVLDISIQDLIEDAQTAPLPRAGRADRTQGNKALDTLTKIFFRLDGKNQQLAIAMLRTLERQQLEH